MAKFFSLEGKFFRGMSLCGDLLILNLMWVLSCLPVITIGASVTALYRVTMEMSENKESYIVRTYWKTWGKSMKSSTFMWMVFLTIQTILICGVYETTFWPESTGRNGMIILFWMCEIFLMIIWEYVFPLHAFWPEKSVRYKIKKAAVISVKKLPWTLLLMMGKCILVAVTLYCPVLIMPFWLIIGVSLCTWASSFVLCRILFQ